MGLITGGTQYDKVTGQLRLLRTTRLDTGDPQARSGLTTRIDNLLDELWGLLPYSRQEELRGEIE